MCVVNDQRYATSLAGDCLGGNFLVRKSIMAKLLAHPLLSSVWGMAKRRKRGNNTPEDTPRMTSLSFNSRLTSNVFSGNCIRDSLFIEMCLTKASRFSEGNRTLLLDQQFHHWFSEGFFFQVVERNRP